MTMLVLLFFLKSHTDFIGVYLTKCRVSIRFGVGVPKKEIGIQKNKKTLFGQKVSVI